MTRTKTSKERNKQTNKMHQWILTNISHLGVLLEGVDISFSPLLFGLDLLNEAVVGEWSIPVDMRMLLLWVATSPEIPPLDFWPDGGVANGGAQLELRPPNERPNRRRFTVFSVSLSWLSTFRSGGSIFAFWLWAKFRNIEITMPNRPLDLESILFWSNLAASWQFVHALFSCLNDNGGVCYRICACC